MKSARRINARSPPEKQLVSRIENMTEKTLFTLASVAGESPCLAWVF
jgi:hypothetical protein